jgi:hypothetical protein
MGASVEEQMDLSLSVPSHDDILQAEGLADVVVGLSHLTLMPDIDPRGVPDLLKFFGKYLWIRIQRTVDLMRVDQLGVSARRSYGGF